MKNFIIFLLYFCLGAFLIFGFKKTTQIINSQQLQTPVAASSFSLETAPSKSFRGTIVLLSGEVGWQSRIATSPAQITKPMQIQQGEEVFTKENGQATVVFSKIANVEIHPKTEVDFIQTLPGNILIGQNSGAAEYATSNNNQLNVRSLDLLIKINQGDIEVSVSENKPYITIDVKTGSITIGYNDTYFITQVLNVSFGNEVIYNTDTKKILVEPLQ